MAAWKEPWIWRVRDLNGPILATKLLENARNHMDRELIVDLSEVCQVYPNGAVPFAAALAFLRETTDQRITVRIPGDSRLRRIEDPLTIENFDRWGGDTLTHSVWRYDTEADAQRLTNMYMEALTDQVQCEEGVIDSITWCLYEVMDNVFAHSHAGVGYVMMQLHKAERRCVIAVADTGVGIQRSLVETRAAPLEVLRDPSASIDFALEQGATSKGGTHQGNGLYGLRRAVEINGGALSVTSGWGRWTFRDGEVQQKTDRYRELPDKNDHQSTLVDWQLDCSRKVRIDEALGSSRQINDLLETIEDDEGAYRVSVREIEESLGSRKLGAEIRTRLENYLNAGAQFVILDFKSVGVVSSSFADEVLAKLASSMGELEFRRRVFVDNASVTNRGLIERAISLRLGKPDSGAS
ncbi:STAS-like domain-containing protein [Nocardia nova]|uniref:STAS-like domain-containing protein n=1 Tax=Nocardia nova TaxID=37330 RepID=UPI0011B008EC